MAYTKQTWSDLPNTTTPINATRLNHMEDGIEDALTDDNIKNTATSSTTDTYSCDYSNKLRTYSTTEQKVGTWIDGKPIYRKVIETTTPAASSSSWTFLTALSGVDNLIELKGIMSKSDGQYPVQRYEGTGYYIQLRYSQYGIECFTNGYPNIAITLIVEYTKTTN